MQNVITAIDVGTTKVTTFIAEPTPDGHLRLLGAGSARSQGMRKGVVVNVSAATKAITESIERAEHEAGATIRSAYIGIAGAHISSRNGIGAVALSPHRGITRADVDRALDASRAIPVPTDREIIHTIARSFTIDQQEGVQEPIGMHGYRLEVDAHIITGASTAISNLVKCIQGNGIAIDELVLQPLASGEAVLTNDEREMGVVLVDIGGGTTDIAIYLNGSVWHAVVLEIGGDQLTRDLAVGLHTPFDVAEQLKIRYGQAVPERVAADENISASAFGDAQNLSISRRWVAEILQARCEEILEMVLREVRRSGYDGLLPAGAVFTGGAAQLAGLKDMGRALFEMPVRIGTPTNLLGARREWLTPAHATGQGLLLWGQRNGPIEGARRPSSFGPNLRQWLRTLLPGNN